jgi:hypothetical protein
VGQRAGRGGWVMAKYLTTRTPLFLRYGGWSPSEEIFIDDWLCEEHLAIWFDLPGEVKRIDLILSSEPHSEAYAVRLTSDRRIRVIDTNNLVWILSSLANKLEMFHDAGYQIIYISLEYDA